MGVYFKSVCHLKFKKSMGRGSIMVQGRGDKKYKKSEWIKKSVGKNLKNYFKTMSYEICAADCQSVIL